MDEGRLFRARKTLMAMLKIRGFDVPEVLRTETDVSFRALYAEGPLPDIIANRQSDGERIGIGFAVDDGVNSVRVIPVRQFADRLKEEAISRGILVLGNKLTSFAAREVRDLPNKMSNDDDEPRIECFTLAKLYNNIMEYELQPRFELMSPAQLRLKKLRPETLWHMLSSDPVACFMGLDPGQVVRITRRHSTAGFEIVYRVVVDASAAAVH